MTPTPSGVEWLNLRLLVNSALDRIEILETRIAAAEQLAARATARFDEAADIMSKNASDILHSRLETIRKALVEAFDKQDIRDADEALRHILDPHQKA